MMNVARRRIKLEDNSYERNRYNVLRECRSSDIMNREKHNEYFWSVRTNKVGGQIQ
jgi:hypothetical protein